MHLIQGNFLEIWDFVWGKDFVLHYGWRRELGNAALKSPRSILFRFILLAQLCELLLCVDCLVLEIFNLLFCRSRQEYQQTLNQWLLVIVKVRLDLFLSQLSQTLKLNGRKCRFSIRKCSWQGSCSHQTCPVHIEGTFAVGTIAQSLSLLGFSLIQKDLRFCFVFLTNAKPQKTEDRPNFDHNCLQIRFL